MADCINLSTRKTTNSQSSHLLDNEEINGSGYASFQEDQSSSRTAKNQQSAFARCWQRCCSCCRFGMGSRHQQMPRLVTIGRPSKITKYAANTISNQKYSLLTFPILVLFQQFRQFLNFCFLIMALSQFVPQLRIGYLYTYWGPLAFVISVTMVREAIDDIRRWRRDRELNSTRYEKVTRSGHQPIASSDIKVGDLIRVNKNERVPADMILLRTGDSQGACYLRTDQLDGETDWKLRNVASNATQQLATDAELLDLGATVLAERPSMEIYNFIGTLTIAANEQCSLSIENTMWTDTVVASNWAVGVVIYTGCETRAAMNNSLPRTKLGKIDEEINVVTILLVVSVLFLSLLLVGLKGFGGEWYKYYWRFFLLFSYIIPLALRVNLDMAKIVYSFLIMRDENIEGNIVRNTTIPEELGRINYLLTDKTGTLTENEMIFKKLHLGTVAFTDEEESQLEIRDFVAATAAGKSSGAAAASAAASQPSSVTRSGADVGGKAAEAVKGIALCHNVTPVYEEEGEGKEEGGEGANEQPQPQYQASSPDEVALVNWTATVGMQLVHRDLQEIKLRLDNGKIVCYKILQLFPFTSDSKRMGVIVQSTNDNSIVYYTKGADSVIGAVVAAVDWLEEEVGNLAREGLRTLLVARRQLTQEYYTEWAQRYEKARLAMQDRVQKMQQVQAELDNGLHLLCLTGVEDRLQYGVRQTLETMRNAGVKVWMLTGDKLETACCIAKSSRLVEKSAGLFVFQPASLTAADIDRELVKMARRIEVGESVVISGECLQAAVEQDEMKFVQEARKAAAVVVCRCSPTQKAEVVRLLQLHTKLRCAAVGDGGNDVAMIQAADCGLGIVGKEGKQASLAADFSIAKFHHVSRLMLVHGRRCYKNTAMLAQFIIHRGLIISTMQAVFSAVFFYVAISLFPGILMIGYATAFTMFPVFSLVLDRDVPDATAEKFPELYRGLLKGRELSTKTFFIWTAISIYQGGIIMYGSLWLFEGSFLHIVSIAFTALVITELDMVAIAVRTWHWAMVLAEVLSLICYLVAVVVLPQYFDPSFLLTLGFLWRVAAITAVSSIPIIILSLVRYYMSPPIARKLQS